MTNTQEKLTHKVIGSGNPRWRDCPRAIISISHGNPNHLGLRFAAIMEWANRRFKEIVINVSDAVYRHNLIAEGVEPGIAFQIALRNGDIWIASHQKILDPYKEKIISHHRWSDWTGHREFETIYKDVMTFYAGNENLRKAVEADIEGFMDRKIKQGKTITDALRQGSRNYLLEELAVYTLIGRTYKANRVYPGKDLLCFDFMRYSPEVPENLRGLSYTTHLNLYFKKRDVADKNENGRIAA